MFATKKELDGIRRRLDILEEQVLYETALIRSFVVGDVKVPSLKTRVDAIAGYLGIEIGWKETKIAGVVTRKIKRGRRKRRAIKVSQARKRKK